MTNQTEAEALLPCPLCGGGQITTAPDREFGDPTWSVICKACGCRVERDLEEQAITAWNTRLVREDVRPKPCVSQDNSNDACETSNGVSLTTNQPEPAQEPDAVFERIATEFQLRAATDLNLAETDMKSAILANLPELLRTPQAIAELKRQGWVRPDE